MYFLDLFYTVSVSGQQFYIYTTETKDQLKQKYFHNKHLHHINTGHTHAEVINGGKHTPAYGIHSDMRLSTHTHTVQAAIVGLSVPSHHVVSTSHFGVDIHFVRSREDTQYQSSIIQLLFMYLPLDVICVTLLCIALSIQ